MCPCTKAAVTPWVNLGEFQLNKWNRTLSAGIGLQDSKTGYYRIVNATNGTFSKFSDCDTYLRKQSASSNSSS
jgi:hypothetical protein